MHARETEPTGSQLWQARAGPTRDAYLQLTAAVVFGFVQQP